MKTLRLLAPILMTLLGAACGDCGEEPSLVDKRDAGPVDVRPAIAYADLDGLQQLVVMGDSVAAGYGVPISNNWVTLLMHNDDDSYPAYADRDLETLRAGSDWLNLAVDEARIEHLVEVQLPNVPRRSTLIIVAAGIEDFVQAMGLNATDGAAAAATFGAELESVLAGLRSMARFQILPNVYLVNLIDPSDGVGDFGDLFGGGDWPDGMQVLDAFNAEISRVAGSHSAQLIDAHQAFLGHGAHFDDASAPHYNTADPSAWLQNDLIRPSARGHSELRELLLDAIVGP